MDAHYRRLLLETEARILAENQDYIVVALRLQKSLLDRNLHFMAALADRLTGEDPSIKC